MGDSKAGNDRYRAFLLRCWCDDSDQPAAGSPQSTSIPGAARPWRFGVTEITHEQHRHGLRNLDELIAFLHRELRDETQWPNPQPQPTQTDLLKTSLASNNELKVNQKGMTNDETDDLKPPTIS